MDCYSFYEKYQQNDNEWWKLSEGEMQNLYDDTMGLLFGWEKTTNEQIARAEAAEAEVVRLTDELAATLRALIGCDGDEGRDTSEYVARWEAIMGDKWQG